MLRNLHESWLLLVTIAAAACTPVAVIHTAKAPNVAFDRYETFGFEAGAEAPEHFEPSSRSGQVRRVVREETGRVLEAKGYRLLVAGTPDLVLAIAVGRRERYLRRPTGPDPLWLGEEPEEEFTEGAFVIDAFDGATQGFVWHGAARTPIETKALDEARLRHDVDAVLRAFPPGRAAPVSPRPQ